MPKTNVIMIPIDRAMERSRKIRQREVEDNGIEESQGRFIEISADELGFDSAKIGEDDMVKLQFVGRVKTKADGKLMVSVDNIMLPKEPESTQNPESVIPSPSA